MSLATVTAPSVCVLDITGAVNLSVTRLGDRDQVLLGRWRATELKAKVRTRKLRDHAAAEANGRAEVKVAPEQQAVA